MSKIGKQPVDISEGIKITLTENDIHFEGPKGSDVLKIPPIIEAKLENGKLVFRPKKDNKESRMLWGTTRALANNIVIGLKQGYAKTLEIEGIGYRVEKGGDHLNFYIGYNHPVKFEIPAGIDVEIAKNQITVRGSNKRLVGDAAARIKSLKKVEPYKGKGIKYAGESPRRKEGKKAAAGAGAGAGAGTNTSS